MVGIKGEGGGSYPSPLFVKTMILMILIVILMILDPVG